MTCFLPPIGLYCVKGKCDGEFCINLILTIFIGFPGVCHAFYVYGLGCCEAILCLFLPPIGVLVGVKEGGCSKACICLLLTLLFILPGVMYAYYVCLDDKGLLEQGKD